MIAHLHTAEVGGFMIGTDHIPRIGEKIRIPAEAEIPDDRDGMYVVEDVVYGVPCNHGRQRVDIYARRMKTAPADLSYSAVSGARYDDALERMAPR